MEYRVLGPLEVRDGDRSLPLAGAKQRALLALLLVHANHVVSRDRLVDDAEQTRALLPAKARGAETREDARPSMRPPSRLLQANHAALADHSSAAP